MKALVPSRAMSAGGYSPSPRPRFDRPTAITSHLATRHIWGDDEAGHVADHIYASTDRIHALVFELPAGGAFRHSREFRTVFGADEVLHVLEGTMVAANPETGEVQRVGTGERLFFRKDTWHHAFAHGGEPLRVLELFAPPPSAGTSGAYARERPYLDQSAYADDDALGQVPGWSPPRATLHRLEDSATVWRRRLGVLEGIVASTEHLTVATLEVNPGEVSAEHEHGGDEVLYVLSGSLWVRARHEGSTYVFEVERDDAVYLPIGSRHEYRNSGRVTATALAGIAPAYAP
jgi:mannose-6-phosphate isomerase-like protein (cupin superfamily)